MAEEKKQKRETCGAFALSDHDDVQAEGSPPAPLEPPILETERLRLISPLTVNVAELVERINDPEIARGTLTIPHPYTERDAHEWFERVRTQLEKSEAAPFIAIDRESGGIVGGGGLGINWKHRHAELGYWIARDSWGRGYATEIARAIVTWGFNILGLHRIHAHHFTRNPASGRVLEKIGMTHEGTLRQHILKDGEFIDVETYAVLRSESTTE